MKGNKMRIGHVNTYSPKFGIISEWKKERVRAKAAEAQEEYIRKRSYSSNPKSYESTDKKNFPPEHPYPDCYDYHARLKACRDYANSLNPPGVYASESEIREWNEYKKYRTKR